MSLQEYLNPVSPRSLARESIEGLRELTRVMCIALGGETHIVQETEDEGRAFSAYVRNDGFPIHVEIWNYSDVYAYGVHPGMPKALELRTEGDLARLLRQAKGMEPDPQSYPGSTPPPFLVDYAGHARVEYAQ